MAPFLNPYPLMSNALFLCLSYFVAASHAIPAQPERAAAKTVIITPETTDVPSALGAGDTVILKNGVYRTAFSFSNIAGTPSSPIVIRAETPGQAVFDGSQPISLAWQEQKNYFTATSDVPPHALCRNGGFLRHAADPKSIQPGMYNIAGAGPWTISYCPLNGEDVASLQFSRGVMETAFQLTNCAHVALEGFKIVNFGLAKPPTNQFGIVKFGATVVSIDHCAGVTVRGLEVNGFFGTGIGVRQCNDTTMKDSVVKNGYGIGIGVVSDTTMGEPVIVCRNNGVKGCVLSHIYQFNRSQLGYMVKGVGVNGNQGADTVIDGCVFHSLVSPAKPIHFDVRSGWATVKNSLFFNNGSNGRGTEIHLENRIHDVAIENNLFAGSHCGKGISFSRCWNIRVRGNTFYRAGLYPLSLEAAYNFAICDNVIDEPGRHCMMISRQALKGEKVVRGLVIGDGKRLYDFIRSRYPDLSTEDVNARLKWAGVAPLEPDGSEPDDVSWKNVEELKKRGYNAMSARSNPNGNGIDVDPPQTINNVVRNNLWHAADGKPFGVYVAAAEKEGEGKEITVEELMSYSPQWDFSRDCEKPQFADEKAYDLRMPVKGIGASDDLLLWARSRIAEIQKEERGAF